MSTETETIYTRVQDPDFSDWRTLRSDVIGEGAIIGSVYHASGSMSCNWTIVRMPDGSHLACNRIHPDAGLDAHGKLYASAYCAPPIEVALACIKNGKKIKTGRDSWIAPAA